MIEIDEKDMINHHKLNKSESYDFIHFLNIEIERHLQNIRTCRRYINAYKDISETLCLAFDTSIHRHKKDIRYTRWVIKLLRIKHGDKNDN